MTRSRWFSVGADYGAWPFPRHYVRPAWFVALLVVPPVILAYLPPDDIAFGLILVPWLGTAAGISVVALLDWSSMPLGVHRPIGRAVQMGTRALISALGAVGVSAGIWMLSRIVAGTPHGIPVLQPVLFCAFGLGVCLIGAQLTMLPYARLRRTIDERRGHGA